MKTKVNWLEWGRQAFDMAKKEDKPILLDLTAVWCHWCHVMDSNSYSDEECARIINEDFVPIKVYIDKRPDLRERYNMGGFPSTVFLNTDGYVISGETYVEPKRFRLMLSSVRDAYKNKKNDIKKNIENAKDIEIKEKKPDKTQISYDIIKEILLSIEDNFDSFYGGFGIEPKFPSTEAIDLLFMQHQKNRDKKYLSMALKTLDCMHEGIYDNVDFGFFRYSVTRDWKMPHYEKMLDTNAGLLRNYALAYNTTKMEKYKKIAIEMIDYLNKFLSDQKNGGFYGSQDADEEFYNLKPEERRKKAYPYVDKTIYVDWNALMISSYIKAGAILNDEKAIKFAIKTADFILEKCHDSKKGMCHFFDGKARINGLLSDNIHFLNCLIDAYYAAQNKKYLKTHENQRFSGPRKSKRFSREINDIAEFILKNFYDRQNSGFFDRIVEEGDFGALKHKDKHFLENSFCAIVFLRLYFLTKEEKYKQAAGDALIYFADSYVNFGYFAAIYAVAADMIMNNEIKVDIVNRKEMINSCIAAANPRIVVNFIDKNNSKTSYEAEGAYVCKGTLCKGPIKDKDKLEEELTG